MAVTAVQGLTQEQALALLAPHLCEGFTPVAYTRGLCGTNDDTGVRVRFSADELKNLDGIIKGMREGLFAILMAEGTFTESSAKLNTSPQWSYVDLDIQKKEIYLGIHSDP